MTTELEIKKAIGKQIKAYRKLFGLTQFSLGEKLEINQRQIAILESGKSFPSLKTLVNLSNVFNCNVADFFPDNINEKKTRTEVLSLIDKMDYQQIKALKIFIENFMK